MKKNISPVYFGWCHHTKASCKLQIVKKQSRVVRIVSNRVTRWINFCYTEKSYFYCIFWFYKWRIYLGTPPYDFYMLIFVWNSITRTNCYFVTSARNKSINIELLTFLWRLWRLVSSTWLDKSSLRGTNSHM